MLSLSVYVSNPSGLSLSFSLHDKPYISLPGFDYQTQAGSPGHLAAERTFEMHSSSSVSNPSGLPDYLACVSNDTTTGTLTEYQTRAGSPDHLADVEVYKIQRESVSIKPVRAPRPVRRLRLTCHR